MFFFVIESKIQDIITSKMYCVFSHSLSFFPGFITKTILDKDAYLNILELFYPIYVT